MALTLTGLVLGGVAFLLLRQRQYRDLESLVGAQLRELVADGSERLYRLDFDSIDVDFSETSLYLRNVRLRTNQPVFKRRDRLGTLPEDVFSIDIKSIRLSHFNVRDFLAGKGISLQSLRIENPVVRVYHKTRRPTMAPGLKDRNDEPLYQKIRKHADKVHVGLLELHDIRFHYVNQNRGNRETRIQNVHMRFHDIRINEATQHDSTRFFFARNATISMDTFTYFTRNGLYQVGWNALSIDAANGMMEMRGFQYHPRKQKDITTGISGKNQFDIHMEQIRLYRVDWWKLAWEEGIRADSLVLHKGSVHVYNKKDDNMYVSKLGRYPHQLLQNAEVPVYIPRLRVDSVNLVYEEYNPASGLAASIPFQNVNGVVTGINSLPAGGGLGWMELNATASFLGKTPMQARLAFNMDKVAEGEFRAQFKIGALDLSQINHITIPLSMLRIHSLQMKELDADILGNNQTATGSVNFRYSDMKVELLKKNRLTGGFKTRKFFTYIANEKLFRPANLGDTTVRFRAAFKRQIDKSMFSLIWKTILNGMQEAARKKPRPAPTR